MQSTVEMVTEDTPVLDAMQLMMSQGVGSLVVQDSNGRVVGFLTQRDLLRCIYRNGHVPEGANEPVGWNVPVSRTMTLSKDLVFLSPKDSLESARSLMAISGKRHVPVLSGETLLGVISPKDIARFLHLSTGDPNSAKSDYVSAVLSRKGMPLGTRLHGELDEESKIPPCELSSAVCSLPHHEKVATGGEDAHFIGPHMVGVADGVGSWWEAGVDPSKYARGLMAASVQSCSQMKRETELLPQQVLLEAWHKLQQSLVVGSCTACLVALHPHKSELRAANVGDSGFIIVRPSQPRGREEPRGTLDASIASPSGRAYHVAFRSPQQLRAFNTPFQLGRASTDPTVVESFFETPHDASLVRVPVRKGDLLVLASDGLFDNMDEEGVLDIIEAAEKDAPPELLARRIAQRAQELSHDDTVDSPFAILAKDNDIMWGGGRPDDITVIVSRIFERSADTQGPPPVQAFAGPGPIPEELVAILKRPA